MPDSFSKPSRVTSVDLLRGVIMAIMALDHVRDYFHGYSYYYDCLDLAHTSPAIFFTRWITHYCAPVFIFLAGTSASFMAARRSKAALSRFLVSRGLWLVFVEITIMCIGWFFNFAFTLEALQVIWVIGLCMIVLAALIHLPKGAIAAIGLLLVFGHNLLDPVHVPGDSAAAFGWSVLHEFRVFHWGSRTVAAAYPIVPWCGVMGLGYVFGDLFKAGVPEARRRAWLLGLGIGSLALFCLLRGANVYGDPHPWTPQPRPGFALLSFLNVNKYPPSLLYLLMTLGPAFLFLAIFDRTKNRVTDFFSTFGRVPFFYYILHVYLLHLAALFAAHAQGFAWSDMVIRHGWITQEPQLKGYGFSLPGVYAVWIALIALLYPLCRRYDEYKQRNKQKWWLSYL